MKKHDLYEHYKGKDYEFWAIALPIKETEMSIDKETPLFVAGDAHTPDGEEILSVPVYKKQGIYLIDREEPHVLYQAKGDLRIWVRKVDDFFGFLELEGRGWTKRFTKLEGRLFE